MEKLRNTLITLSFLLCLLLVVPPVFAVEFPREDRVLIVYGNPDVGPWEQQFNGSVLRGLATESGVPVVPEFLSLINADLDWEQMMAESLRLKYSRTNINLVIAVLPEANSFVSRHLEVFAPNASVLHVLPGTDVLQSSQSAYPNVIIDSAIDSATIKTTDAIFQIFPDLRMLFVVGGNSAGDLSYTQRIREAIDTLEIQNEIRYLIGLPPDVLLTELASAPAGSAILMSTYDTDSSGGALRSMAINELLVREVRLPIFSTFDTLIESGSVGGNVTSPTAYATSTVQVTLAMLSGEFPREIQTGDSQYLFDGSRLNAFGIDRSRLPADSVIINEPYNAWEEYGNWILAGSIVLLLQSILVLTLLTAIRRRKKAEAKLAEVHKMEALGSLAGGISHDFNNILMVMMSNAELAAMSLSQPDKVSTFLDNILAASRRASDLIKQILMFSVGLNSSALKIEDARGIVTEAVDHLRAAISRNCEVDLQIDDDLFPVRVDETQLTQIILNLGINAEHAMDGAGSISISLKNEVFATGKHIFNQVVPPGDYVVLSVSDMGSGISKQNMTRIFDPFFTTKPRGKGTGLGLPMVYRIVDAHNGFIDVESTKGKGTTFTVYLPAQHNASVQDEGIAHPTHDAPGNGENIMLVDDDLMLLQSTERLLLALGYEVVCFQSSVDAYQAFESDPDAFDLLLTDLSLPEMDGIRLISKVRALRPTIPVILYTAYYQNYDSDELDNVSIMTKPLEMREMAAVISGKFRTG